MADVTPSGRNARWRWPFAFPDQPCVRGVSLLSADRRKSRNAVLQIIKKFSYRNFKLLGRPALRRYLNGTAVSWHRDRSAGLQLTFWQWVRDVQLHSKPAALALPELTTLELRKLADLVEPEFCGAQVRPLEAAAPVPGILAVPEQEHQTVQQPLLTRNLEDAQILKQMQAWVGRTLSGRGLKLCPYTGTATTSASGLERYGIPEAPILYVNCDATTLPGLLTTFWDACLNMLNKGESRISSIIISAPHWNTRFDEWYRVVFPLLEDSVLAGGLIRDLGVVNFHPDYSTPSEQWLAKNRFGPHVPSLARLRDYVEEVDPKLSAATDDDALRWAGEYQRRSPHAMINVLWSRQLLLAEENGTKLSSLYTRNIGRLLRMGREELERALINERAEV